MIIGNAASGKSRLGRHIAKQQGLPYHALDHLLWQPHWQPAPSDEFHAAHEELIARDSWIIDGVGSWHSIKARLLRADTFIHIDLPFPQHLFWVTKRQIASLITGKDSAPQGCKLWKATHKLYPMMVWMHREMRPRLHRLALGAPSSLATLQIQSRAELTALYQ